MLSWSKVIRWTAWQVAEALDRRLLEAVDHEQQLAPAEPEPLQQLDRPGGLGGVEVEAVQHDQVAPGVPVGQGRAQGQHLLLLVDPEAVVAGRRPEDDAAAAPLRGPDGALAGPSGPLLAPGLLAPAADLGPGLGRVGAGPGGGELGPHDPVHHRHVDLDPEDLLGQLDRAGLLAVGVEDVDLSHWRLTALTELRTITRPRLGPGTAPRISSWLRSGSALTTSRLRTVTRWLPMWPAIRIPLKMRAGVAQAPTEPGERCLRSVPWEAHEALEAVALHHAGEALALGHADDVDPVARGEHVGLELLAEGCTRRRRRCAARPGGAGARRRPWRSGRPAAC